MLESNLRSALMRTHGFYTFAPMWKNHTRNSIAAYSFCTSSRKCRSAHQTESVDLHIRPKVQICTSDRKCRSAHQTESVEAQPPKLRIKHNLLTIPKENVYLHIRPKVQIGTSERKCRSAHQTESADLHIRPKVQICTSDRKCRSAHKT